MNISQLNFDENTFGFANLSNESESGYDGPP